MLAYLSQGNKVQIPSPKMAEGEKVTIRSGHSAVRPVPYSVSM